MTKITVFPNASNGLSLGIREYNNCEVEIDTKDLVTFTTQSKYYSVVGIPYIIERDLADINEKDVKEVV